MAIDKRFLTPPNRSDVVVDKEGRFSQRMSTYLESLGRTIEEVNDDIISIEQISVTTVNTSTYNTDGDQRIVCLVPTVITLQNTDLIDGTEVTIKRVSGQVTINSPLGIDGDTTLILTRDGTSVTLIYNGDLNNWFII